MTDKIMYWISIVFSALSVLLVAVNIAVIGGNRTMQAEINSRQASIDTAIRFSQLNQNLAQALAESAAKNNDKEIRDLLYSQGITIKDREKEKEKDSTSSNDGAKKK